MKTVTYALAASTVLGYVTASLNHHAHDGFHQVRRNAAEAREEANTTCSCTTTYTTYYGQPTLIQPAPQKPIVAPPPPVKSASSSKSVHPIPSSAHVSPPEASKQDSKQELKPVEKKPESKAPKHEPKPVEKKPESEAPKHEPKTVEKTPEVAPKPVEKTPEPAAKPLASKPHKSSHHVIGSSGSQWCMTYSPYNGDGTCKDKASVSSDIAAIAAKGFTSVRLYSTDCSGLLHVGAAVKSHRLKLVLGIYISNRGVADAAAQIQDIIDWTSGDWGRVEMIVVGNEALFNGYCAADALVDLIAKAKAAFAKAGYSGPITTAEPINILKEHAASLCPVLDVVAANIHPFFNSDVTADTAGDFVAQELQHLQQICPGLDSYNLETGWPSAGSHNGAAVPGVSEQQAAIISIQKKAGSHSVFFSFVDDKWKDEGQFGVEPHWGCAHLFGDD